MILVNSRGGIPGPPGPAQPQNRNIKSTRGDVKSKLVGGYLGQPDPALIPCHISARPQVRSA